jgi:hypothetical protein
MRVNTLLVRWVGGWAQIGSGGREATLGLGAEQSMAEVVRVAQAQLDAINHPRTAVAVEPIPVDTADMPWLGYRIGDYVSALDWNGTPTAQRVLAMTGALDDNGRLTYSVELQDRVLGERERVEQSMKKMTNGTLRGASKVATPVGAVGKRNIPPPPPVSGCA